MKKIVFGCCMFCAFIGIAIAACSEDCLAITKSGYYVALNDDVYNEMQASVENGDKEKISFLLA